MIEIGRALVNFDVVRKKFRCNIHSCKGVCCIHGDAGAPLTVEESGYLEDFIDDLKPYLSKEGFISIKEQGTYVLDIDGEIVTPLIKGNECSYTVFENGIASCAIEKAFHDGAVPFNKPVSCHLYPIRIKEYKEFDAVNYDIWEICSSAREEGIQCDLPVYLFAKEGLIRKYGIEWFEQLDYAAKNLDFDKLSGYEE
jgi:hypothetical protein